MNWQYTLKLMGSTENQMRIIAVLIVFNILVNEWIETFEKYWATPVLITNRTWVNNM